MAFANKFLGKRVLVTGHTGFKGAWLAEWLLSLGAEVTGFSLPAPTSPALFAQLDLPHRLTHIEGDIRDLTALSAAVKATRPQFVFHLAAQPLVLLSYQQPVETYATNIMGTVHLLEAIRQADISCAVVCVTTDKCYENREWVHSYREEDPVGGYDPYSSSKGATELMIHAYRRSFFSAPDAKVHVASARAGNVIGGGDWALDRIVPDCIRSLARQEAIGVRNKTATRPWQHVLEPLSGYLWLAARLEQTAAKSDRQHAVLRSAFNFGPALTSNRTVAELVQEILLHWPGRWDDRSDPAAVHEAKLLNLSTDKAFHHLRWRSVWDFSQTIAQTVTWYNQHREASGAPDAKLAAFTKSQIQTYEIEARRLAIAWAD